MVKHNLHICLFRASAAFSKISASSISSSLLTAGWSSIVSSLHEGVRKREIHDGVCCLFTGVVMGDITLGVDGPIRGETDVDAEEPASFAMIASHTIET